MAFVLYQLADATAFRVLSIVELYTHECVGLVPSVFLRADDVIGTLNRQREERGVPAVIHWDSSSEFTSGELDHWCDWKQVRIDFSRPSITLPISPTSKRALSSIRWSTTTTGPTAV